MSKINLAPDASGTGIFTIASPDSNTNRTLTLPDETGTVVTTGTTTGISASAISTGTLGAARLPAGSVLQVVSVTKTDAFQTTSTSYVDITGLSVSITPTNASSKILVLLNISASISGDDNLYLQLVRNSTAIGNGTAGTNASFAAVNGNVTAFQYSTAQQATSFLDSPNTTSSTTYKAQTRSGSASFTANINRRNLDTFLSASSTITLLEIAA